MTKDEFVAIRFASQLKVAKQRQLIADLEKQHEAQLEVLLANPQQTERQLKEDDEREHDSLIPLVDFIPFKCHDFVRIGVDAYYVVEKVHVNFARLYDRYSTMSPAQLTAPPENFMKVNLDCRAIRKSGLLARYSTNLNASDDSLRKVDISEHVCLRRALKQRMRRRLEGGD